MDEEKKIEQTTEETVIELPESSRREFITKLVTAAGAVAAAGLVAGQNSAAAAEFGKIEYNKAEVIKDVMAVKIGKVRSGFRLSMSGRQLGSALKDAGLLQADANLDNATITIEFTA